VKLPFYKYQGTGNDFILIDNRRLQLPHDNTPLIRHLCDRRFGIGADGLMLLQEREGYDFEMVYFNSDGRESTMCGNGGRCIVKFAQHLGLGDREFKFLAIDGPHQGKLLADNIVSLQMKDVLSVTRHGEDFTLDTGSPHVVRFVKGLKEYPVVETGRGIRYADTYRPGGTNVNFAEEKGADHIYVRTYERGVEDETLSCGTGVVASAIAHYHHSSHKPTHIYIDTPGGKLEVQFDIREMHFVNIWLKGHAHQVFEGQVDLSKSI
jgi:diaminopimelate epimerase